MLVLFLGRIGSWLLKIKLSADIFINVFIFKREILFILKN